MNLSPTSLVQNGGSQPSLPLVFSGGPFDSQLIYTYDIEYRASKYHGNADALSRLPRKTTEEADDWSMGGDQVNRVQIERTPITDSRIREVTRGDPVLSRDSCMVGQQKKLPWRSFDISVPNVKSLPLILRMTVYCVVPE